MYRHDTGCPEADVMMAMSIGDEEAARQTLTSMSDWALRQLATNCSQLEWTIRALLDVRAKGEISDDDPS